MDVFFESSSLKKEFLNEKKLFRKYGARRARLIGLRIFQFQIAENLAELRHIPGLRLHQHVRSKGQEKAIFTVDLDHPYRLVFQAAHDPEPELTGGGVDWHQVTAILIKGIEDPHG